MHSPQILDKHGHPISIGDTVYTPFRGGKHEGQVEAIVTGNRSSPHISTAPDDEESRTEAERTINPPKVLFHDQKGRRKEHRPQALADINQDTEEEMERDYSRPVGQRPTASMHQARNPREMTAEEYERLDGSTKELMEEEDKEEKAKREEVKRNLQGDVEL